jgi:hypothetical protein
MDFSGMVGHAVRRLANQVPNVGSTAIEIALAASARQAVAKTKQTGNVRSKENFVIPTGYVAFDSTSFGNFPYCWQDPMTQAFNSLTYEWISAGLLAGTNPVQQDGVFTNRFLSVFASMSYTLSTADQKLLDQASADAIAQQQVVLAAWRTAFGSVPSGSTASPPIDLVIEQIVDYWASPPTSLNALLGSADPIALLNTIPPNGTLVVPPLLAYLNQINSAVPLLNEVTQNNGLQQSALAALQSPNSGNGGLMLNSDDGVVPRYCVTPSVSEIIAGLSAQTGGVHLALAVCAGAAGNLGVGVNGSAPVTMRPDQLIALAVPNGTNLFAAALAGSGAVSQITAGFFGVTIVNFGPAPFSSTALQNWMWKQSVTQAIADGAADVSGFKFSPEPGYSFGPDGDLCYLTSAIISNNPCLTVELPASAAADVMAAASANPGTQLSFLGRALGTMGTNRGYRLTSGAASAGRAKIVAKPGAIGAGIDACAYVLAVKTACI